MVKRLTLTPARQKALLIAVELPHSYAKEDEPLISTEESLVELTRLAETAGFEVAAIEMQHRSSPDSEYYVGSGKAAELRETGERLECTTLIFDDELSGAQARNLEEATSLRVVDRTQLILEIFAGRARSREGRLQVDLARLTYALPRLAGRGIEMSRTGASAGQFTRGPGEPRLETDRRVIRARVRALQGEIEELRRHRALQRQSRRRIAMPLVSLVGYTNAGKSSLLNTLTAAGVLAEDQLFATLDPTTRGLDLPDGGRVLLTDTVGFIRKLPHSLVAAFRATLEDAAEADLLVHVVDASSPVAAEQAAVVRSVLHEAGAADVPVVVALNKIDLCDAADVLRLMRLFPGAVAVSAQSGAGINDLLDAIAYALRDWREELRVTVPYAASDIVALLHERGEVAETSYGADGVAIVATVDRRTAALVRRRLGQGDKAAPAEPKRLIPDER